MEYEVFDLFPTAVLASNLGREFTKFEQKIFDDISKNTTQNTGNLSSADNYILKRKGLETLHDEMLEAVNFYLRSVVSATNDLNVYITQSWTNYTRPGQYHHKHSHPNSYLSGVLYFDADEENDKIYFYSRESQSSIEVRKTEWNRYNSPSWWLPARTGRLYIFPSTLTHMVESKQGDNLRVSLAFNTFLKGKIGTNGELTELIL